jgi:hypothetical protein
MKMPGLRFPVGSTKPMSPHGIGMRVNTMGHNSDPGLEGKGKEKYSASSSLNFGRFLSPSDR